MDRYVDKTADVVTRCDQIVVGTLHDIQPAKYGSTSVHIGLIRVSRVLWGTILVGEDVVLQWPELKELDDYTFDGENGRERIWCINNERQPSPGGDIGSPRPPLQNSLPIAWRALRIVRAPADPNVVRDLCELEEFKGAISSQPVFIHGITGAGSRLDPVVEIVFRNPTDRVALYPGIVVNAGKVFVSEANSFVLDEIWYGEGHDVAAYRRPPLEGKLEVRPTLVPIAIPPLSEYRMRLRVRDIFDIKINVPYDLTIQFQVPRLKFVRRVFQPDLRSWSGKRPRPTN